MANETDKTELISITQAAQRYGFSSVHLRQMAREGRLRAQRIGNYWVTTAADVEAYIASRKRTGRFRKDIEVDS